VGEREGELGADFTSLVLPTHRVASQSQQTRSGNRMLLYIATSVPSHDESIPWKDVFVASLPLNYQCRKIGGPKSDLKVQNTIHSGCSIPLQNERPNELLLKFDFESRLLTGQFVLAVGLRNYAGYLKFGRLSTSASSSASDCDEKDASFSADDIFFEDTMTDRLSHTLASGCLAVSLRPSIRDGHKVHLLDVTVKSRTLPSPPGV